MRLKDYFEKKSWKNNLDKNLPEDIIKKINKISKIQVISTCSGHPNKTEIVFKLNKVNNKTFNDVYNYYNKLVNDIKLNVSEYSIVKWLCWIETNLFFYDSLMGYNKKTIQLKGELEPLKNEIPSEIFIKIINSNGLNDKDFYKWWNDILMVLEKLFN